MIFELENIRGMKSGRSHGNWGDTWGIDKFEGDFEENNRNLKLTTRKSNNFDPFEEVEASNLSIQHGPDRYDIVE